MSEITVNYSIDQHDADGNVFDDCILISCGNAILRFENLDELISYYEQVGQCIKEIEDVPFNS